MAENFDEATLQARLETALPGLSRFLSAAKGVFLVELDSVGKLCYLNAALREFLKLETGDIAGTPFTAYLTTPEAESFSKRLAAADFADGEKVLLNLVDTHHVPNSVHFQVAPHDTGYWLFGEPPVDNNTALHTELLELNNQLSVLSRENTRKGRALAKALETLKETQAMLVHKEKMASLGLMTAGIAHEINNPLAFVYNNEQVLLRDFEDLLAFINTLGDALPEIAPHCPRLHQSILAKAEEIDLAYLVEAMPRKLQSNLEGLERVKQIILDLRNFSRLDEAERKPCDIAESIEATLRFLGALLKEQGVTVETDFAQLPPLLCTPGPLNQVLNAILSNAVQASEAGQRVHVTTRLEGRSCCIEVTDHGSGIAEADLEKVFDPFFTTKPVGTGTGLGLSIAHQIVEAHQGHIAIDSTLGEGTTVRVYLPYEPDNRDDHAHGGASS